MIRKLGLISLISMALMGCTQDSAESRYELLDGGSIDLAASPKLVFINYWAVWCAPCRKEIPEFNEFAHEHAEQVTVLGVILMILRASYCAPKWPNWALSFRHC